MRPCSVVLLLNFVPPYRVALFRLLAERCRRLTILVSTPMEKDRPWPAAWQGLDVRVQRSLALPYRRRHPQGFAEELTVHLPLDTLPRLIALAPDIAIAGEFGPRTLQALLYRRLAPLFGRRCRVLVWATVSEHTEQARGPLRALVRRLIAALADGAVTNGESGARYLVRIGFPEDRVFRIHQSIDLERFEALPRPAVDGDPSERRLVTAGNLIERKGLLPFLARLVRWCAAHPDLRLHWRIVGDGPERAALEAFPLPANLALEVAGALPYEAMPSQLADRDLMVFPTLADEWGLVVNEAMAAGLPALASRYAQAAEEMVEDGINGWLFRPDDDRDTAAALDRALGADRATLARMGGAARETARRFSHADTLRRLAAAIERVQAA